MGEIGMKKKFLITIDTEGDNLWAWKQGDAIRTENVLYLQRFQNLCNRFDFKPVWLSNYEMLSDSRYVDFISSVEQSGTGELGMHLHAWSTPPEHSLAVRHSGAPYLIEYPIEGMEEKIAAMTDVIRSRTGVTPVSHRAGRWAMDQRYFDLLVKYGYQVDCSVTPHVSWESNVGATENSRGSDYSQCPEHPYEIPASDGNGRILQVPMSIRKMGGLIFDRANTLRGIAGGIKNIGKEKTVWMRPNGGTLGALKKLQAQVAQEQTDYLMFMIHSSELMPGGSPTFPTATSIEALYNTLESLFAQIAKSYEGETLRRYVGDYWRKER